MIGSLLEGSPRNLYSLFRDPIVFCLCNWSNKLIIGRRNFIVLFWGMIIAWVNPKHLLAGCLC